jgi:Mrp family chromosome partitioning ATPase
VITLTSSFLARENLRGDQLSVELGADGQRVAMVDLDIRKGTMSKRLGKSGAGVTSFLSGQVKDPEKLIQKSGLDAMLDVVPSGPVPPNPAELLLNERLDELMAYLREQYDYVVVDNMPSFQVADTFIINRVVDLTIYVVSVARSRAGFAGSGTVVSRG